MRIREFINQLFLYSGKLLVVVILAVCCSAKEDVDYCDTTLCKEGKKNIACNNDGVSWSGFFEMIVSANDFYLCNVL